MSNNYMNIGFRLELEPKYWSDSFGIKETDKEKLSALLHEYIHYLQDTCTYYGALYRKESYDDTVNDTIKGSSPDDILYEMPNIISDSTGYVTYGNCRVGSLLIKESMATMAQMYAFQGCAGNIQRNIDYNIATNYVVENNPCLKSHKLLLFATMDILLMTENPGRNLVFLTSELKNRHIDNLLKKDVDEKLLPDWYDLCENQILAGLVCYDKVQNLNLEGDYWTQKTIIGTGHIEISKGVWLVNNKEIFCKVVERLRKNYCNNIKKRCNNDHAIVPRLLAAFARDFCMNDFYNMFGYPIIVCSDEQIRSNIKMFVTEKDKN